jgi:hypothetical protein
MLQEILTYIIVLSAFAYTIYSFMAMIIPAKNGKTKHACSSGCTGCSIKDDLKRNSKIEFVRMK